MKKSPVVNIVKKSAPAVVTIIINEKLKDFENSIPSWGKLFPSDSNKNLNQSDIISVGNGSGILVSPAGIIVTNRHVIEDPNASYTVVLENKEKYPVEILARDPINDIAILKINVPHDLPFLELGSSFDLELGEEIITIGNALGEFNNTVSTGVVAGLSRYINAHLGNSGHELRGLIQTDAAINPGNSGGPLLNMEGKVAGINTAIIMGAQNIGFSIPIDSVKKDLEDLSKYGRLIKPMLGLRYLNIDENIKKQFNLPVDNGAVVIKEPALGYAVAPNGPADKAGIKEGDIVISCDNIEINEDHTLQDIMQELKAGSVAEFEILREGKTLKMPVTLEERK